MSTPEVCSCSSLNPSAGVSQGVRHKDSPLNWKIGNGCPSSASAFTANVSSQMLLRAALLLTLFCWASPKLATGAHGLEWLKQNHWLMPSVTKPASTPRTRHCSSSGCSEHIGTPNGAFSVLFPFLQDQVFCDIGCRKGELMQFVQPHAKEVYGLEINREYVLGGQRRGLPVFFGDFMRDPLPSECQVVYFWIDPSFDERFVSRAKAWFANQTRQDNVVLLLPAEPVEPFELRSIEAVQRRHGGVILKIPFHEGPGYRHFGVLCILVIVLRKPDARAATPTEAFHTLLPSDPQAHRALQQFGWLFYPQKRATRVRADADRELTMPYPATLALRDLTKGKVVCDLNQGTEELWRSIMGTAPQHKATLNTTRWAKTVGPGCGAYYVPHDCNAMWPRLIRRIVRHCLKGGCVDAPLVIGRDVLPCQSLTEDQNKQSILGLFELVEDHDVPLYKVVYEEGPDGGHGLFLLAIFGQRTMAVS